MDKMLDLGYMGIIMEWLMGIEKKMEIEEAILNE